MLSKKDQDYLKQRKSANFDSADDDSDENRRRVINESRSRNNIEPIYSKGELSKL